MTQIMTFPRDEKFWRKLYGKVGIILEYEHFILLINLLPFIKLIVYSVYHPPKTKHDPDWPSIPSSYLHVHYPVSHLDLATVRAK